MLTWSWAKEWGTKDPRDENNKQLWFLLGEPSSVPTHIRTLLYYQHHQRWVWQVSEGNLRDVDINYHWRSWGWMMVSKSTPRGLPDFWWRVVGTLNAQPDTSRLNEYCMCQQQSEELHLSFFLVINFGSSAIIPGGVRVARTCTTTS